MQFLFWYSSCRPKISVKERQIQKYINLYQILQELWCSQLVCAKKDGWWCAHASSVWDLFCTIAGSATKSGCSRERSRPLTKIVSWLSLQNITHCQVSAHSTIQAWDTHLILSVLWRTLALALTFPLPSMTATHLMGYEYRRIQYRTTPNSKKYNLVSLVHLCVAISTGLAEMSVMEWREWGHSNVQHNQSSIRCHVDLVRLKVCARTVVPFLRFLPRLRLPKFTSTRAWKWTLHLLTT